MARTTYDTTLDQSTPSGGRFVDLEQKHEQVAALVNEHAAALDNLIDAGAPAAIGKGQTTGRAVKVYADGGTAGAVLVGYLITIPDHATQDVDTIVDEKIEVIDSHVKKITANAGANANTFQVKNAANAITDAMSINGKNRGDIVRCANIDDTGNAVINAGGTLRITQTKAGGDASGRVFVGVVKRA